MHRPVHSRFANPNVAPKRPAAQTSGADAPREHQLPRGQIWQLARAVRFAASPKNPAGHAMAAGAARGQ
eukprot:2421721-Prymnesium_polylepis.1